MVDKRMVIFISTLVVFSQQFIALNADGVVQFYNEESGNKQTSNNNDYLRTLLADLNRPANINNNPTIEKNEDDHSNIELDKLNDVLRYETITTTMSPIGLDGGLNRADNLNRLLTKALVSNQIIDEIARSQVERKRSNLRQLLASREDKDYSFVGLPMMRGTSNGQFQRSAKFMPQKLRDLLLYNGKALRLSASDDHGNRAKLDQFPSGWTNDELTESANELKSREKRRRCKVDPNLGVKNPSYCDTDAYFGAADYSMRDVWDSAGR